MTNLLRKVAEAVPKIRHKLSSNFAIALVIIAGMASNSFDAIFSAMWVEADTLAEYYGYYFINFVRTLILILLCHVVILSSASYRLFALMLFMCTCMFMDLASLVSTDWYYALKPFRYGSDVNFTKVFLYYEIVCLIYCVLDGGGGRVAWYRDVVRAKLANYPAVLHGRDWIRRHNQIRLFSLWTPVIQRYFGKTQGERV